MTLMQFQQYAAILLKGEAAFQAQVFNLKAEFTHTI